MARVTVEDCYKYFPNRYELVVLVSRRAQQIKSGARSSFQVEGKKISEDILALKEAESNLLNVDDLKIKFLESLTGEKSDFLAVNDNDESDYSPKDDVGQVAGAESS